MLRDDPRNWEAMYRRIVSLWKDEQTQASIEQCQALLDLNLAHSEPSAALSRGRQQQHSVMQSSRSSATNIYPEVLERVQATNEIRRA